MIIEYVRAAMRTARYETIHDDEPFYGEIDGLKGVWATGKTSEECREKLAEVLDGWILFRLSRGLAIPPIDGVELKAPEEFKVA